jgi:regulator of protease activity HflC (stomatin/prohibitin superfamily)
MMSTAFSWLSDFIYWVLSFIPRIVIVSAVEDGVAFIRGKNVRIWKPGLHFYWPVWTTYELVPTKEQMVNLADQCVLTSDGKAVMLGGLIFYEIVRPEEILGLVNEPLEYIASKCMVAAQHVISSNTLEFIQAQSSSLNEQFIQLLTEALTEYGVDILDAAFSDLASCRVFRISGITPSQNTVENYAK